MSYKRSQILITRANSSSHKNYILILYYSCRGHSPRSMPQLSLSLSLSLPYTPLILLDCARPTPSSEEKKKKKHIDERHLDLTNPSRYTTRAPGRAARKTNNDPRNGMTARRYQCHSQHTIRCSLGAHLHRARDIKLSQSKTHRRLEEAEKKKKKLRIPQYTTDGFPV